MPKFKVFWKYSVQFLRVSQEMPPGIQPRHIEKCSFDLLKPTYNVHRFQTVAPSGPRFGGAFSRVAVAAGNFIRRFLRPPTAVQRPLLRFIRPRRLQPVATKFMVDPAQVNFDF